MILLLSPTDRPDPPVLLQITDPKHRAVTLSWTPGDDHNSAVLGLVQTNPPQTQTYKDTHLLPFFPCFSFVQS